ncbi:MAG: AraC family transcriptional regulator [Clostridiales bacterium]|nr:AraC family transcriptional regulator [Clostridiales bacterium]
MLSLIRQYHPLTGDPFWQDESYWELAPCDALKPYIRCFWGSLHPVGPAIARSPANPGLVIPDTCMDIIFDINYTQNRFSQAFCTLDERSYRTSGEASREVTGTFAIRFYAWTASLFADLDFTGLKNQAMDASIPFRRLTAQLSPILFDKPTLAGKAAVAEAWLLHALEKIRPDADLLNAVHTLLKTSGRARIHDLCDYAAISQRKLERLFQRHMGISPKSFATLARYQLLWQDLAAHPGLNLLDAVEQYGYTDQAHLLHDFRQKHLMTPAEALQYACHAHFE